MLFFLLIFNVHIVFAAEVVSISVPASVTVLESDSPLVPELIIAPPSVTCSNSFYITGRAEVSVGIYLNDSYVTDTATDGTFGLTLYLDRGENHFEIKTLRGEEFSDVLRFTLTKEHCDPGDLPHTYHEVTEGGGTVPLEDVADHLDDRDIDDYIEDVVVVDDILDPIEELDSGEGFSPVEEAVGEGIEYTYDDFDEDGISDFIEEVLDLDGDDPDSDRDGVLDVDEVSFAYQLSERLSFNLVSDAEFTCGVPVFVHGEVFKPENVGVNTAYDYTQNEVSVCFFGDDDQGQCFTLEVDEFGDFYREISPGLRHGSYNAEVYLNEDLQDSFTLSCIDKDEVIGLILAKVGFEKVYQRKGNRFQKRSHVFAFSTAPIVRGIGPTHDLVTIFWQQNERRIFKSLTMSDVNGIYEVKPHHKLETFFGVGYATVSAYGMDSGVRTGSDTVNVWIFDLVVLALELIILLSLLIIYRSWRKRRSQRKN